jgi:Calpain family cysteine protease
MPLAIDTLLPRGGDTVLGAPGIADGWGIVDPELDMFLFGAGPVGALANVLYLREVGDTALITANDIHQGQLGDCYLLSSFGEAALFNTAKIQNMIHQNSNGTETVTLYTDARGGLVNFATTAFKAVSVTVQNSFDARCVNNGATQDVVGTQKEIWAQVLEKAYATLHGGYNAIGNGGYPVLAMEELTGHKASWMSAGQVTEAVLRQHITAGDVMTFDTGGGSLPYGLVGGHCYMFQSLTGTGSTAAVHVLNPWGFAHPAAIPVAQLAKAFVEVDFGHF